MKLSKYLLIMLCTMFMLDMTLPSTISAADKIIFSVDQGWGNGIIQATDTVGIDRVANTLKSFKPSYDVYVIVNPMNSDKTKLDTILNRLVIANIPFIFDVYTSDTLTIGSGSTFNEPYDTNHGLSLSLTELQNYKNRYPNHFAGVRIFETFSLDFTIRSCKTTNPEWCLSRWELPTDNFYNQTLVKNYLDFAKQNNMLVFWSEYHWYQFNTFDTRQQTIENGLRTLFSGTSSNPKPYANTLILGYGNNDHKNQESWKANRTWFRLNTWQQPIQDFANLGGFDIGLSDQSWACGDDINCPVDEIIRWSNNAWEKGSVLVQFEPSWYFFKFPRGIIGLQPDYTQDPAWKDRGYPTNNLITLAQSLGITITPPPTNTPTPTLAPIPGDSNGDRKVDGVDYLAWLSHYNQTLSGGPQNGDFNSNGKVDGVDYLIWLTNHNV